MKSFLRGGGWRVRSSRHPVLQNKFKANLDYMIPCIKPNERKSSTFFCSELLGGRFSLILIQVIDVSTVSNTVSSKSILVTGIRYCYEKFKDSLPRHLRNFLEVKDTEDWDEDPSAQWGPFSLRQQVLGIKGSRTSALPVKSVTNVKVFSFFPYPLPNMRSEQGA